MQYTSLWFLLKTLLCQHVGGGEGGLWGMNREEGQFRRGRQQLEVQLIDFGATEKIKISSVSAMVISSDAFWGGRIRSSERSKIFLILSKHDGRYLAPEKSYFDHLMWLYYNAVDYTELFYVMSAFGWGCPNRSFSAWVNWVCNHLLHWHSCPGQGRPRNLSPYMWG